MNSTNPMQRPASPRDVLDDDTKSREEKEKYLEDWRLDLLERVRATEENMVDNASEPGEVSDQLQRVDAALAELRES